MGAWETHPGRLTLRGSHLSRAGRARSGGSESGRYFGQRGLLGIADGHAADAQEAALVAGLGGLLSDIAQPGLERRGVIGRLCVEEARDGAQFVDGLALDVPELAALELRLERVTHARPGVGI